MTMLMHELKAPLSSVQLASASLGRRINPDTEAASQTHSIRRSVDDLIETIEHCVQAAENVQNDVSIDNTSFSLTGLLADLLNQVASDRIDLLGPQDARVHTDKHKLESMLWHLLNQALKDSPAHSRVELAIQASARNGVQGLSLTVTHAISAADMAVQLGIEASSEPAQPHAQSGSGLDSWLAKELALQLGLALEIHVDPQHRGSRLWLPGA
jgi:signal transduction histidine kinase